MMPAAEIASRNEGGGAVVGGGLAPPALMRQARKEEQPGRGNHERRVAPWLAETPHGRAPATERVPD